MLKSKFKGKEIPFCEVGECTIEGNPNSTFIKYCYFCNVSITILCKEHSNYRVVCNNTICRHKMNTFPEIDFEYLIIELC